MRTPSSLYPPLHPPGSRVLVSAPPGSTGENLSHADRALVYASSLFFVGSVAWVPLAYVWAYRRWRSTPKSDRRRRMMYMALILSAAALAVAGPHRSKRVGRWLDAKRWRLWRAWLNFMAFEVVSDRGGSGSGLADSKTAFDGGSISTARPFDVTKDKAIIAVVPHGIFPFALAFAALPEAATKAFGEFRPVVATATALFPFVRTFLGWLDAV